MAAQFGRRLRKGAATTAVAAVAVAALSASQAPGVNDHGRRTAADAIPSPDASTSDGGATGNSPYYTDLPPLNSPNPSPSTGTGPVTPGTTEAGIPATVLDAYKKAETALREAKPGCNLPWQLLAAIGRVESGQARGGRVSADGTTTSPILGPQLDGNGFALIKDTDNGAYDGNSDYDQAVGPMQFIPSTWAWAGRDGNDDGKKDPNNVYDAALAAGHYLCRNNWDLSDQRDLDRAILSYNNSREYLNLVMRWLEYYRKGTHEIPDGTGTLPNNRSDNGAGASPTPATPSTPGTTPKTQAPGGSTPKPSPRPDKPGGGGTTTPKPPTTTPPGTPSTPPTTPPTPTDTVDHLEGRRNREAHRHGRRRVRQADQHPRRDEGRQGRRQGPDPLHDHRRHGHHLHRRRECRHGRHQQLRRGRRARSAGGGGYVWCHRPRHRRGPCGRPRLQGHRHRTRRGPARPHR
ncbi:secreted protein [Streptomyces viridochromogenes DSM 40736]|uniref:Secreted protein n=1 Tax=Streptomyces viridochromogenes (strain DSM 40736 / JCM 4977 / BCRC 1201 / Tue 494) TaxID=591159 RepID=D9X1Y0_STRVT|nr:secreted protein [Streptomyces viridochromogenes DSM 40736]